uniref:IS110 family transposase n=1 Tax=Paenibacillus sp. FSL R7-0313 TaxID=2954532 RepID=UPI00403F22A0
MAPTVILESTGHYHHAVIQFLQEHSISFLVVNSLVSHQAKNLSLRKVKTDMVDTHRLCELYTKRILKIIDNKELRNLTRQFVALTQMYVQIKLQFQAVVGQVFPDYRGISGDL